MSPTDFTHLFRLDPAVTNFASGVIASHPRRVAASVWRDRRRLDESGVAHFLQRSFPGRQSALEAVQRYFDVEAGLTALTHSTTMGLGQVLAGMRMSPGQEVVTARNQHPATTETLYLRASRDGTPYRQVPLYRSSQTASVAEIVQQVRAEIRPSTRVLVLDWVSSCDGVKLPISQIAGIVARENDTRARDDDRLLLVVDGVHGFGIEDTTFGQLGCDFFVAGCHKHVFGPRGTAVIMGTQAAWPHVVPLMAALSGANDGPASRHVPGGVKAFEHWWTLSEAFELHRDLGKAVVQTHVHQLAARLKGGLVTIAGVVLVTPMSMDLSSGLVCFDVGRLTASAVIKALRAKNILASESAWDATAATTHVRIAVSLLNGAPHVDTLVDEVRMLAASSP